MSRHPYDTINDAQRAVVIAVSESGVPRDTVVEYVRERIDAGKAAVRRAIAALLDADHIEDTPDGLCLTETGERIARKAAKNGDDVRLQIEPHTRT